MYINLNTVPKRVRTVKNFAAPNPWQNNQAERWSVEAYVMVNSDHAEHFVPPTKPNRWLHGAEVHGIRSDSDGRNHLLPASLDELWKTKQVPDEALPRLLHAVEPQLKRRDFRPQGGVKAMIVFSAIFFLIACALMGFVLFGLSDNDYASIQELKTTNEEWFARPMREGEFVNGDDAITLEGSVPVPGAVTVPSDVRGEFPSTGYSLGWFRAGASGERRLLLTNSPDARNSAMLLYGTTYSPRTLGLPDSLMNDFKTKVTKFNADQVLCFTWDGRPRTWSLPGAGMTALAAGVCLFTLFPLILILALRRRPQKQMQWLRERL